MKVWFTLVVCLAALVGCENRLDFLRASSAPTEAGSSDANRPQTLAEASVGDAAQIEAGVKDAAPVGDAAQIEAGVKDAAPVGDAAQIEADSSSTVEAGVVDSGVQTSDATSSSDVSSIESSMLSDADAAPVCPIPDIRGSECNVDLNCGCAEGQTCRVADVQTGQTLCFDPGQRGSYESCEADQDCLANSYCERGLCYRACDIPGAFCADDSWCGPMVEGGRNVCQGHCNVMPYAINHSDEEFWIHVQEVLIERGTIQYGWDRPYVPCGEGGYCHTGVDPLRPYPHCVAAYDYRGVGEACNFNQECETGYACFENVCRVVAFASDDCVEGTDVVNVDVEDPTQWVAPDGHNSLQVCIPDP